jgi:hypothetical protein
MDLSDAKRLKQLEDENAKLKRLVADVMLAADIRRLHPGFLLLQYPDDLFFCES